jgi:hypothetical protein
MFLSLGQPDKALQPRLLKGHKKAIAFLYASIYWLSDCPFGAPAKLIVLALSPIAVLAKPSGEGEGVERALFANVTTAN